MSKVVCLICGREFVWITVSHLKTHGITYSEYLERFPDADTGIESWNKGLTKDTDKRVEKNADATRIFYQTEEGKKCIEVIKKKDRETHLGKIRSLESKLKQGNSMLDFYQTEEGIKLREQKSGGMKGEKNIANNINVRKKISSSLFGVPKSEEHKEKLRKPKSEEHKRNVRKSRKEFFNSKRGDIYREELRETKIEYYKTHKHPFLGKKHSEQTKRRMKKGHSTEEAKQRHREARKRQKIPNHHTKPELFFEEVCIKNSIPYRYTGDGSLWIPKKGKDKSCNPDFIITTKERKFAIEINGNYWHSPLLNPERVNDTAYKEREGHYRRHKWFMIAFWESDIMHAEGEQYILSILRKNKII